MKLVIGQPVTNNEVKRSVFELSVEGMSGDADHHEISTQTGSEEKLIPYIQILQHVEKLHWNSLIDQECVQEAIAEKAEELGLDVNRITDWFSDMVGRDITSDSRQAVMTDFGVYWYDEAGVKYHVTIEDAIS